MASLFFWRKKKQNPIERAKELMPALIEILPEFVPAIRGIMNKPTEGYIGIPSDGFVTVATTQTGDGFGGQAIGRLYDFIMNWQEAATGVNIVQSNWDQQNLSPLEDPRTPAKPKDVETELDRVPTPWDVENKNLDEKIKLLQDKSTLSSQRYVSAQIKAMIARLENRRKYREHREFYESFPNTTEDKIDELLRKYKLCLKGTDLFVPTFPAEAVDVMKKYKERTVKLCKEEPVFYVIAEEADFKKKEKKLDPILLVQSPFGFYWQILGAWDKEMLLLSEL